MYPADAFHHCPRCGRAIEGAAGARPFRCAACDFVYYFNAAVSVAVFILDAADTSRALFIRRARDPGRGQLALAGGFVEPGERAEDAARREVREEVGVELDDVTWLGSFPNDYAYRGLVYPIVDLYFVAHTRHPEQAAALDAVDEVLWLDPSRIDLATIAFPSVRSAIAEYVRTRGGIKA